MGRRIVGAGGRVVMGVEGTEGSELDKYENRLKNLVPAEVSALYIAGTGAIPQGEKLALAIWAAVCLLLTIFFMYKQTQKAEGKPGVKYPADWIHVAISSISFILWVYVLGGPFSGYGIYVPWIGALLMLVWTFLTPYFYKGKRE
jgi:hypothetical protein